MCCGSKFNLSLEELLVRRKKTNRVWHIHKMTLGMEESRNNRHRHRRALRRILLDSGDYSSTEALRHVSDATMWDEVARLAAAAAATVQDNAVVTSNATAADNEPAKCSSDLYNWARDKARQIGFSRYLTLAEQDVPFLLYVYKHYIYDGRNGGEDEYFGTMGQYTDKLLLRHEQTSKFWQQVDTRSGKVLDRKAAQNKVILLGMHGNDFASSWNLIETLSFLYPGRLRKDIKAEAKAIQALIEQIPDAYDNAILSLNALAVTADWVSGRDAPDALLIGDGLLQFLHDSGLGDNGPDFIHSHEWGHHLQFDYHDASIEALLFNKELSEGEATRRGEMMADAFGAYFLTHPEGGNFDEGRVRLINDIAFSIGDCKIEKDAHHGTPLQRECAAAFGTKLALGLVEEESSDLIHPERFRELFDSALPDMLELNGEICSLALDSSYDDMKGIAAKDTSIDANVTSDVWIEQDSMATTRPTLSPTKLSLPSTSKVTNSSVRNETQMSERPMKNDLELMGRPVVNDTFILADAISAAHITMPVNPGAMFTTGLLLFIVVLMST